jgi:hypothetical protein
MRGVPVIKASTAQSVDIGEREANRQSLIARIAAAVRKRQSPAGALGLPPLLDQRRLEYAMPDSFFKSQAQYDRLLVRQIPSMAGEKHTRESLIIAPETTQKRDRESAPRGIIVSAGLGALDVIRSNGMDLGHIIGFIYLAPFKRPVELIEGHPLDLIILRDGDILDSEDTKAALDSGELEIRYDADKGEHYYFNTKTNSFVGPRRPWLSDQY